jgi:hypothetical protein
MAQNNRKYEIVEINELRVGDEIVLNGMTYSILSFTDQDADSDITQFSQIPQITGIVAKDANGSVIKVRNDNGVGYARKMKKRKALKKNSS